jgi:hypothetical protein
MPTETPPEPEYDDPYEAHFRREPLPKAAVDVLVLVPEGGEEDEGRRVAEGLAGMLRGENRPASARVVVVRRAVGRGPALEKAVREGVAPLVLVTTATRPWTEAQLTPLLKAIDGADHVLGLRDLPRAGRIGRRLRRLPWRLLFRVPLHDVHSPCRLHRREAIAAIPLQSRSAFADVEELAKATFLGHLVDEVRVPDLPAMPGRSALADLRAVFKRPVFVRPAASAPAEDAQGDGEGDDRPGGEDRQRPGDVQEPGALQHHPPQAADDLGQR